jgi:competence protein ComGC
MAADAWQPSFLPFGRLKLMGQAKRPSFSLVELLIVVLILSAPAAVAIPKITGSSQTSKLNTCKDNIQIINNQIESYHINTGSWSSNLKDDILEYTDYFPDGQPECPFDEKYKMDNDMHQIKTDKHNHQVTFYGYNILKHSR